MQSMELFCDIPAGKFVSVLGDVWLAIGLVLSLLAAVATAPCRPVSELLAGESFIKLHWNSLSVFFRLQKRRSKRREQADVSWTTQRITSFSRDGNL